MAPNTRNARSRLQKLHPLFVKLYLTDETEEERPDVRRPRQKVKAARRLTQKPM